MVFAMRMLNKYYRSLSIVYFKSFRPVEHSTCKVHVFDSSYVMCTCTNCDASIRRCRIDPFRTKQGLLCVRCHPVCVPLSTAKTIVDKKYLKHMDSLIFKRFTYFLKADIDAFDFVFDGPRDRANNRRNERIRNFTLRKNILGEIFDTVGVHELDREPLTQCSFLECFVRDGRYGKRFVRNLLTKCYVIAKDTFTYLENLVLESKTKLTVTMGICLSWGVQTVPRLTVYPLRIRQEKEQFVLLIQRFTIAQHNRQLRAEELKHAFIDHGLSTDRIHRHPYVSFGHPSIRETCERMHELKWLHECTPFCDFVELNKLQRSYDQKWITPDPFYDMSYSVCVEAKSMVLSLGYECPTFVFLSESHL